MRINRLPWAAGQGIILTQGWGGTTIHTGNLQYATDWGNSGQTFTILAAIEGDATWPWMEGTGTGCASTA